MKNYLILVLVFILEQHLIAQTTINGGNVSGTWDFEGSPYLVENPISIDYGQTLVIDPGCEIIFQPGVEFLINGTLFASGTPSDSIVFKCNTGLWEGLQIVGLWEYNHSVMDFCIIENANTGILTFYTGSISVSNSRIHDNIVGIHVQHTSAYLDNIHVHGNDDVGIKMSGNCCNMEFLLTNFQVSNNGSHGLDFDFDSGGTQEITNGTISNNAGGGVYSISTDGYITFSNLSIYDNGPTDFGGGIYAYAACLIENCTIENNVANYGGGVYLTTDSEIQEMFGSRIINNESLLDGGGVYLLDGATNVFNCEISQNYAGNNGGGIYVQIVNLIHGIQIRNLLVSDNEALSMGGGLFLENVDYNLDIYQSTISANLAGIDGGAIAFLNNSYNETVEVNSCIIRDNNPNEIYNPDGGFDVSFTNYSGSWIGPGINNIDADPLYVSKGIYAYDLNEGSPCINAGDPLIFPEDNEIDLAGRTRIFNDTIDMGAYESNQYFGPTWGLHVDVWLEGSFNNGKLNNELQTLNMLPAVQPFGSSPWDYQGNDSIDWNLETDISDWILLELYDIPSIEVMSPCKRFLRKAFPLSINGTLINNFGNSEINFKHEFNDSLFISLRHINHLDILSASAINDVNGYFNLNFKNDPAKAYGGVLSQVEVSTDQWAMKAGDINHNDTVSMVDLAEWATFAGQNGYMPADLDLNGEVNNIDKNKFLLNNLGSYSVNPVGNSVFLCGDFLIDTLYNKCYPTVLLGDQCWMAKNLNSGIRIDSLEIATQNNSIEKYCYGDQEENCDTLGGLYSWDEMMNYSTTPGVQGICPDGWHLPTDEEWKSLEGFSDSQFGPDDPEWDAAGWRGLDAGYNSKSEQGWTQNGNGLNLFGFDVIPSGYREDTGGYFRLGEGAYFWSSTESDLDNAWRRGFHFSNNGIHRWNYEKAAARSVRCVQDY